MKFIIVIIILKEISIHHERCIKIHKDELIGVTMNGLYSFYPNSMQQKHSILQFLFSDLFISYQKQSPNTDWYPTHISQLKELTISYKQNIWGVSFDAICYNAPMRWYFLINLRDSIEIGKL
jgi:hypothetical protein